jgi:hypothetical protein
MPSLLCETLSFFNARSQEFSHRRGSRVNFFFVVVKFAEEQQRLQRRSGSPTHGPVAIIRSDVPARSKLFLLTATSVRFQAPMALLLASQRHPDRELLCQPAVLQPAMLQPINRAGSVTPASLTILACRA